MPYCEQIVFKDDATNSVITSIPVNRRVRIEVTVINRAPKTHKCYVRVRLDRERDSSYDFNEASSQQSVSANGGSTTFILRFTPTQPGTYYRTLAVYTYIPGGPTDWDLTDSWLWNMAFDVMPLHEVSVPTVSGPTSGNVGVSYSFTASGASCSQGHSLQYQFDWGDGTQSSWGSATQSKVWGSAGTYGVRVRARCQTDTTIVSGWSSQIFITISVFTGELSGTITDTSGEIISNAKITVSGGIESVKRTIYSTSSGGFLFTSLPIGDYILTVEKMGYQKYISTITITAGQRTIHNVKLIPDKFGPAINNIEINWSTNAVTVIASIEDISGVKEVKLWYKAVGQWIDSGRETLMENVFESSEDKKIYSVTVHFPYDYLQYRIKAYDNLGNETISAAMYQTRGIVPASKREYSFDDKLSYLRYNFEEGKLNDLYFSLLPSGYAMYLPTLMDPIFAEVVLDGFIKEHDYFGRGFKDDIARKVIYKTVLREILSEYSYQKDISENIIVRILEGEIEIIEIIGGTAEIGEYVINLGFFLKSHNLPNISIELIRSGIRIIPGSRKALQNLASLISKLKGGGTVFANYTGILIGLEELFGKIAMGASTVSFSMLVGEIFEKTKFLNNNKDTIMNRSRILQKIQDSEQVFKDSLEEVTNSLTMIDTAAEHWVEIGAYLVSVAQFAANLSGIANIGVGGVTIAAKDYLDIVENLKILCGLGTIYKKIEYALVNDFLDPTDKEYLNHLCKVIAYYYFRTIEKMRDKLSVKMIDFMKFQIEKLFSPANAELWSIYLDSVPERKKEMARKIINEITQPQLMEQTADAKKVMLLNSVSSEIVFENFKVVFPSNSLKSTEELNIAMVKIQKINLSGNMFITTNNQPIVCVDNGYNLVIESSVIKDTFHIKIRKNGQSWPTKELKIAYWSDLNSRPEILHQTTYSQGWYLSSSIRAGIYGLVQFLSPPSDPNNIIPPTQITNGRAVFIDKRTNSPLIGWKLQILTADPRRGGVLLFKKEYDEQGEMVWDEGVSPGHYIYQYFPTKNSKPIIGRFDLNPR
ncbi:MAG: carboxypeptidase regulatory-like domain-containing protein, partial [Endomicrobia bacterium]|nr:carboxypeptidase regulatory-like domain-containing protein [Endomicrobiia bacterium]